MYCELTDEEVFQLEIMLEQIEGCADLLWSYLELDNDVPAMTAVNVTREKARAATQMLSTGVRRAGLQ